ncbi:unnamed protein product [Staurois parvus]|uniref:Uncharacterized protein n=1 Tax=Staurois parvus TaxID=386267 RepID=A0ABN9FCB9_9NEOB|nr:unnamed protein product [Staurois parvus]
MYINGRTVAVQERVAIHKRCLHFQPVRAPWECMAPQSSARCVLRIAV